MLDYEISPDRAAQLLRENTARFVEVRELWEFAATRIEGSVPIPMGQIPSRAPQELKPEERLVMVCHHGVRSMNVTLWLRGKGYDNAQSLRGGIDAWSVAVDPGVARY